MIGVTYLKCPCSHYNSGLIQETRQKRIGEALTNSEKEGETDITPSVYLYKPRASAHQVSNACLPGRNDAFQVQETDDCKDETDKNLQPNHVNICISKHTPALPPVNASSLLDGGPRRQPPEADGKAPSN